MIMASSYEAHPVEQGELFFSEIPACDLSIYKFKNLW
jgi:hypothetical protein